MEPRPLLSFLAADTCRSEPGGRRASSSAPSTSSSGFRWELYGGEYWGCGDSSAWSLLKNCCMVFLPRKPQEERRLHEPPLACFNRRDGGCDLHGAGCAEARCRADAIVRHEDIDRREGLDTATHTRRQARPPRNMDQLYVD